MIGWHEGFCGELVARGLRAIRFDNRDSVVGGVRSIMSTTGDRAVGQPVPETMRLMAGGAVPRTCDEVIPGAELVMIEGMGHDLPRGLWSRIAGLITDHVRKSTGT